MRPGAEGKQVSRALARSRTTFWVAPLVLAGGLLCGGCHLVILGAAAVVVSQEFVDKAHSHLLEMDPDLVWAQTKATLAEMASGPIEIDEQAMAASASIDGAKVTAHVVQRYGRRVGPAS